MALRRVCEFVLITLLIAGCGSPAPAAAPTTAPAVPATTAPAVSPAAKPSTAPSPSASASAVAKPAASPAALSSPSPGLSPSVAPSPSPVIAVPLLATGTATPGFTLQSSAFTANGTLPDPYTCSGEGQSPPLAWSGAPAAAKAFALIVQDSDAPPPNPPVTHWVTYNIPSSVTQFEANQAADPVLANGAMQGLNIRRAIGYLAACPPQGAPAHHYNFELFALDGPLALQPGAALGDVQAAMTGHIVGQTTLVALFGR